MTCIAKQVGRHDIPNQVCCLSADMAWVQASQLVCIGSRLLHKYPRFVKQAGHISLDSLDVTCLTVKKKTANDIPPLRIKISISNARPFGMWFVLVSANLFVFF